MISFPIKRILTTAILISATTVYLQNTNDEMAQDPALPAPDYAELIPKGAGLGMNPVTFEITGPNSNKVDYQSLFNTPELIMARQNDMLQIMNPELYARLYPKTQEELEADAEAMKVILNPVSFEEYVESLPADQRQTAEDSMFALLNPQEAFEAQQKQTEQTDPANVEAPAPPP